MSQSDDNSWVFDSLICFLNGPVWNAPLQSFIEEKSLIFEPSDKDDEEYRKIHDEFKNLVDLMLGSYMEDIGITPEQFEIACSNGMHQKLPARFQENLFEQIWAANDFEMFKRMMTQKNVELQLQALELIEQKYGITPQLFLPGPDTNTEQIIEKLDESLLNHEKKKPLLVPTPSPSKSPSPSTSSRGSIIPSEKQVLVEVIKQCENDEEILPEHLDTIEFSKGQSYINEKKQMLENVLHATVSHGNNDQTKLYAKPATVTQVDDTEIKKRQDYLKAQRDKLVALKKQVRKKHFEIEIGNNSSDGKTRPQSARAAEAVLKIGSAQQMDFGLESETLKIRKALAQRLRSEVIGKSDTSTSVD